jgi:hypothetical protein
MWFPLDWFNTLTLMLIGATLAVGCSRFRLSLDSNWPLMYYGVLLSYWRSAIHDLDAYWILAGLVCALLLRFEFLNKPLENLLRGLELMVFIYIIRQSGLLIFR